MFAVAALLFFLFVVLALTYVSSSYVLSSFDVRLDFTWTATAVNIPVDGDIVLGVVGRSTENGIPGRYTFGVPQTFIGLLRLDCFIFLRYTVKRRKNRGCTVLCFGVLRETLEFPQRPS